MQVSKSLGPPNETRVIRLRCGGIHQQVSNGLERWKEEKEERKVTNSKKGKRRGKKNMHVFAPPLSKEWFLLKLLLSEVIPRVK